MALDIDAPLQHALEIGYAYLNRRERTVSEVRLALERRGVSAACTEDVIRTLTGQGFLDDTRFARLFVADKRELEQWGSERIRRGLLSRGIDRDLVQATVDDPASGEMPESELGRALALLRRRFPIPPGDRRDRERALGLLLRKGYASEVALDAVMAHARDD
ncbi:MAG: RecX family transcriptional regulator [Solirubrobacteraceae bacterium]